MHGGWDRLILGKFPGILSLRHTILWDDNQNAVGSSQLCAGQIAGVDAATHACSFHNDDIEAVLLADASNAFNSLNCKVALHNIYISHNWLPFSSILIEILLSELFIDDSEVLLSQEGTAQGDPLTMPFYALTTFPLIEKLSSVHGVWYMLMMWQLLALFQTRVETWEHGEMEFQPMELGLGIMSMLLNSWLVVKEP